MSDRTPTGRVQGSPAPEAKADELLAAALSYAEAGLRVHPLIPGKKRPLIAAWQQQASRDPETIIAWWTKTPLANVGVVADRLYVIDLDMKVKEPSLDQRLHSIGPLEATVIVRTAHQGLHIYFAGVDGMPPLKLYPEPGVEIKHDNMFLVAPPSFVSDEQGDGFYSFEPYCSIEDQKLAKFPQHLTERFKFTGGSKAPAKETTGLYGHGSRHRALLHYGGIFHRFGLSPNAIAAALRGIVPYEFDLSDGRSIADKEIEDVVEWLRPKEADPRPQFQPETSEPVIWTPAGLVRADIQDPEAFLLPDVLSRGTVCLIAGRRGTGKTYLMLWLAACIALGKPFGPLSTRQGRVLFLSQEMGRSAIRKRLRRLFPQTDLDDLTGRLDVVCKLQLAMDSDKGLDSLAAILTNAMPPYDVVFVDTLRDVKGKSREKDNDEMGQVFVRFRDQICEAHNIAGAMVHHKGKPGDDGQDRGGRGASSMEDVAADVIYLDRKEDQRVASFNKTRDGSTEGAQISFSIQSDPEDEDSVWIDLHAQEAASDESSELRILYVKLEASGASTFSIDEIRDLMSWSLRTARRRIKQAVAAERLKNLSPKNSKALYRYSKIVK